MKRMGSALVGLAVAVVGCRPLPGVPVTLPTEETGEKLYVQRCASCHGVDGTGRDAAGVTLPGLDLTTLALRHRGTYPRKLVVETMMGESKVSEHRLMPSWDPRVTSDGDGAVAAAAVYARRRIDMIASYVESLQRFPEE
jgi:mono/diheme cytochrome c family protein